MVFALLSTIACGPADPADQCREGTTLAEDGHCYPPLLVVPPDIQDAIAALPVCDPVSGPGFIDLARGCANGACANDDYEEFVAALGEEGECVTRSNNATQVICTWEELGIDGIFQDDDEDDVPDENARTSRIHLFTPYYGQTEDGVGIGANLACFFDFLGTPDELLYTDQGGQLMIEMMDYGVYGLEAYDWGDDDESGVPNGYIDHMYLTGA